MLIRARGGQTVPKQIPPSTSFQWVIAAVVKAIQQKLRMTLYILKIHLMWAIGVPMGSKLARSAHGVQAPLGNHPVDVWRITPNTDEEKIQDVLNVAIKSVGLELIVELGDLTAHWTSSTSGTGRTLQQSTSAAVPLSK